jgi:hypothetical protein
VLASRGAARRCGGVPVRPQHSRRASAIAASAAPDAMWVGRQARRGGLLPAGAGLEPGPGVSVTCAGGRAVGRRGPCSRAATRACGAASRRAGCSAGGRAGHT